MNNTHKHIIITIILFLILTFSGCFTVTISGEIDENYMAVYKGDISVNLKDQENSQRALTQDSLLKLSEYWQGIGYESAVTLDDDTYNIYFKKQIQCDSYEKAFEELFKMMTDDYSPFSNLDYTYTEYVNYTEYIITGSIDISESIDTEVYDNFQEDLKQTIDSEMQNLNANIVFILPSQAYVSEPASLTKTYTAKINANEATDFTFTGKINNTDIESGNGMDIDQYQYYNTLVYILGGILFVLVLLTLLVVNKLRKNTNT